MSKFSSSKKILFFLRLLLMTRSSLWIGFDLRSIFLSRTCMKFAWQIAKLYIFLACLIPFLGFGTLICYARRSLVGLFVLWRRARTFWICFG